MGNNILIRIYGVTNDKPVYLPACSYRYARASIYTRFSRFPSWIGKLMNDGIIVDKGNRLHIITNSVLTRKGLITGQDERLVKIPDNHMIIKCGDSIAICTQDIYLDITF